MPPIDRRRGTFGGRLPFTAATRMGDAPGFPSTTTANSTRVGCAYEHEARWRWVEPAR